MLRLRLYPDPPTRRPADPSPHCRPLPLGAASHSNLPAANGQPYLSAMDMFRKASDYLHGQRDVLLAYAFGSVVEGRCHRESDLDLAVLFDWDRSPEPCSASSCGRSARCS